MEEDTIPSSKEITEGELSTIVGGDTISITGIPGVVTGVEKCIFFWFYVKLPRLLEGFTVWGFVVGDAIHTRLTARDSMP
jgi:hypothetical protein